MKLKVLTVSTWLVMGLAPLAHADFPTVVIDTSDKIVLNYDKVINIKNTNIPTDHADVSVNQFNHNSAVKAVGNINGNRGVSEEIIANLTAVGNNASVDVELNGPEPTVGSVQGNQNSAITAQMAVNGNTINTGTLVEVEVTAVANNLSIENESGGIELGAIQYNYESPTTAIGSINRNGIGVNAPVPRPRDPSLTMTAVGNNIATIAPTTGSIMQINRNSPVTAIGSISGNIGNVGPINFEVTAVGNNFSVKQPGSVDHGAD